MPLICPLLVLDSHSWDDFPNYLQGADAHQLLTAWTSLWHPQFLLATQRVPLWCRPEAVSSEAAALTTAQAMPRSEGDATNVTMAHDTQPKRCVVLRPSFLTQRTDDDFPVGERSAESSGESADSNIHATLRGPFPDRPDLIAEIFRVSQSDDTPLDQAAHFFALGYGYMQAQLLTCQMGYSSYLDQDFFLTRLLQAAEAAAAGKGARSLELLQGCFDTLAQQRDHYYPVAAYILDITVVDEATCGRDLHQQLSPPPIVLPQTKEPPTVSIGSIHDDDHPHDDTPDDIHGPTDPGTTNLLMTGQTLNLMARQYGETLSAVRSRLDAGSLALIGGLDTRLPLSLVPSETTLADIRRGCSAFELHLDRRPTVFAMQRFGLHPDLPQVLLNLGFQGVCHFTLDDGQFPIADQVKTAWNNRGGGGTGGGRGGGRGGDQDAPTLDAICCVPLDSSLPETYLRLAIHMGLSIEKDHVATVCLVHRPSAASVWHQDAALAAQLGLSLGRFSKVDQFLAETSNVVGQQQFTADDYRVPFLEQDVAARVGDPLSQYARRTVDAAIEGGMNWMAVTTKLLNGGTEEAAGQATSYLEISREFADTLGARNIPDGEQPRTGTLLVNPHNVPVRSHFHGFADQPANHQALGDAALNVVEQSEDGSYQVIATIPGCGYLWLDTPLCSGSHRYQNAQAVGCQAIRSPARQQTRSRDPAIQDGLTLRNEFLQVDVNSETGGIQLVRGVRDRVNRLSQQIAIRADRLAAVSDSYSRMVADRVTPGPDSNLVSTITSIGRLLDSDGNLLARFEQCVRLVRGSRIVEIDILLDLSAEAEQMLAGRPWRNYVACRWAWPKTGWTLYADLADVAYPRQAKRALASSFLDLQSDDKQTAILTGGMPYFVRCDANQADSLLVVQGESNRHFHMGIALDTHRPAHDAIQFMAPPVVIESAPRPASDTGWLFHCSSRRVRATYWEALRSGGANPIGPVVGFRVRLRETGGLATCCRLTAFLPISLAFKTDFTGNRRGELPRIDGQLEVELAPHEWTEVEAYW